MRLFPLFSFVLLVCGISPEGIALRPPAPLWPELPMLPPLAGKAHWHTVGHGETLFQIARQYGVDSATVARLNGLAGKRLRPGMAVLLPTRYILPNEIDTGIVLNIPERGVYVFDEGRLLARYSAAVGQPTWRTPTGKFVVEQMVRNPTWLPPEAMVKREGAKLELVPPGPENPLGDRWMGWSHQQVGFHNTYCVTSIGHAASHGCVRLYPEAGRRMFTQVFVGMPIVSLYQPVKVGQEGSRFYLSVSPDIYHTGLATLEQAQWRLAEAGLLPYVALDRVRHIVARKDGYPHEIARLTLLEAAQRDRIADASGDKKLRSPSAP